MHIYLFSLIIFAKGTNNSEHMCISISIYIHIYIYIYIYVCRCTVKIYPKDLPTISVILIYLNEALSVIKRAICSIIDKTPAHLLKEIILVDDYSSNGKFYP